MVEYLPFKQNVDGSIPSTLTKMGVKGFEQFIADPGSIPGTSKKMLEYFWGSRMKQEKIQETIFILIDNLNNTLRHYSEKQYKLEQKISRWNDDLEMYYELSEQSVAIYARMCTLIRAGKDLLIWAKKDINNDSKQLIDTIATFRYLAKRIVPNKLNGILKNK